MDDYDRRVFLKMSLPGFLGLSMALPGLAQEAREAAALDGRKRAGEPMEWDAFIESVSKFAGRRVADDWSEEKYVKRVAGMARRLNIENPKLQQAFEGYVNKNPAWPEFEALHKEEQFEVALVEFEKGERIAHHDHPQINGVICCASGDIAIQNYDFLPATDSRPMLLKKIADMRCKAGAVSTLTAQTRNIHALEANAFTQLVDVFSPPYNTERSRATRWFKLDDEIYQGIPGVYECTYPGAEKKAPEPEAEPKNTEQP